MEMALSSWLGWVSSGFCVAAFTPSLLSTWANRNPTLKPVFLYCWLLGDTLNLIGSMMSDASFTQKLLAWWYSISDLLLLGELFVYGSPYPYSPRQARQMENENVVNHRTGWKAQLAERMRTFSKKDDIVVMIFCAIASTTCFGIATVVQLSLNPDYEIAIPTEINWPVFGIAWAAMITYSSSRVAELVPAFKAWRRGESPTLARFNIIFIALLLMNIFQLASILTLSTEIKYLIYEAPWLASTCSPPLFDLFILFVAAPFFHRTWSNSPAGKAGKENLDQAQLVVERLSNLVVIARQKFHYRSLLRLHTPPPGAKPSVVHAYNWRRSQIEKMEENLINSPQMNREKAWAHSNRRGMAYGPLTGGASSFAEKLLRVEEGEGEVDRMPPQPRSNEISKQKSHSNLSMGRSKALSAM